MAHFRCKPLMLLACLFACGEVDDTPDVPVVTLSPINTTLFGRSVPITFTVSDKSSRLVNVTIRQGLGEARDLATTATDSPDMTGLSTSPEGRSYTFRWNSVADIGYEDREAVYLGISVTAGGDQQGIADTLGPIHVDNENVPRTVAVHGAVSRAQTLLPPNTPAPDLEGRLYIGLWSDLSYPPTTQPIDTADLGRPNLEQTSTKVDYAFLNVSAPGQYLIIVVFDVDENNVDLEGGYSISPGDLTNLGGAQVPVDDEDVERDIVVNLIYIL